MTANLALALLLTSAAPPDLGAIWKDLTQNDDEGSKKAWEGMRTLIQAPESAVPFLKERVKPAPQPDRKRVEQCLADLDSKSFRTRENVAKELEAFGQLAALSLDSKLADQRLPLEARQRT